MNKINDETCMTHAGAKLYFERTFYSITEGEMISVCILMDPDIQKPILINVIPSSTSKPIIVYL